MYIDNYQDFVDEIANYEFLKLFYSKYKFSRIKFNTDTFQNCLKKVTDEKKPLIFFLHNENEPFSQDFCELITNKKDIEDSINQGFSVMGWNINSENIEFSNALINKTIIVEEVRDYIKRKQPCIFFIVPNDLTVKVHMWIENKIDESILRSNIKDIQKFVAMNIKQDYFQNMTSIKYQQWVYEELSDRDYDSFERNEHDMLKKKILYAIYGPPKELENDGYKEQERDNVDKIYQQIKETNNKYVKWNDRIVIRFIYNCTEPLEEDKKKKANTVDNYVSEEDFCPIPVFVLRKCKGKNITNPCRIFIDNTCRVYESWKCYVDKNALPPCKMVLPNNGQYQKDESGDVHLEEKYSPSCSTKTKVLQGADITSGAVSLSSGVACIAAALTPAAAVIIPAAIVGGFISGAYAVGRSVGTVVDRKSHKQSLSIKNPESRAAYLNIAAGVVSAASAGTTQLIGKIASTGTNIGTGTRYAVNALNGFTIVLSGTATVNSGYEIVQKYQTEGEVPSTLTLMQLSASLFFFGNSIVNFRTAGSIIKEAQTSTISEISDALRSNRHRKAFNKLLKETIRTQGGAKGRAEVIATMRNPGSRDDILAVLVRSNKNFNKQGIKFSAGDGGILLNGVPVEILEFGNVPKTHQGIFFEDLPGIPDNYNPTNITSTANIIDSMKLNKKLFLFLQAADVLNIKEDTFNNFKQSVWKKIAEISGIFLNQLDTNFILQLKELFSGDVTGQIILYVADFIRTRADDIKDEFEHRLLTEEVKTVCRDFGFENPAVTIRNFIDYVIDKLLHDKDVEMLTEKCKSWYTTLVYRKQVKEDRKKMRYDGPKKQKVNCSVCGGHYY